MFRTDRPVAADAQADLAADGCLTKAPGGGEK